MLVLFTFVSSLSMNGNLTRAEENKPSVAEALTNSYKYLLGDGKSAVFGSEWNILSLARGSSNVPQDYFETYYQNVVNEVIKKEGKFSSSTDYSRVIIALTAIGKDPTDVGGYNLVEKLYSIADIKKIGINGAVYALIALDTNKYSVPTDSEFNTNIRQELVDFIVSKKLPNGGFAWFGDNPDMDITGMAIQALSNYIDQPDVKGAIDQTVELLSTTQQENGGYVNFFGTATVESVAQVLVALTSIGINPETDSRFIKGDGNGIISNIMTYYNNVDGAFIYNGKTNMMATQQASYALIAHERLVNNQNKLYDMSDAKTDPVSPEPEAPYVKELINPTFSEAVTGSQQFMLNRLTNPIFGSEWFILALARAGAKVPEGYYDTYYKNVVKEVEEKEGVLHKVKLTEYSRLIVALTAIGRNPQNVGGYDLTKPLFNYDDVIWQGINGPIWALIALDTNNYPIEGADNSRQQMIDFILSKEITSTGGWSLSGKADPDITGMGIQALSRYTYQTEVKDAVDRAVVYLSNVQKENGGYASWNTENVESASQVLVALTDLGINPKTDPRFIKGNGSWILSNILSFYNTADPGFKHIMSGKTDAMATEQAAYSLAAYERFVDGNKRLYDMTDIMPEVNQIPEKATQPIVNSIGDSDITIKGTAEVGGEVYVRVDNSSLLKEIVNEEGEFAIKIPKQKAGTSLKVFLKVPGKLASETVSVQIEDNTPPELTVNPIGNFDKEITGTTEAGAKVEAYINEKKIQSTTANEKGSYILAVDSQVAGTPVTVKAFDQANNETSTTLTVTDKTPLTLTMNSVSDSDTTVTGKTKAGVTVELHIGGKLIQSKIADTNGNFTFSISNQKIGEVILVTAIDQAGNRKTVSTTVRDVTAPRLSLHSVSDADTEVTGTSEPGATVGLYIAGTSIQSKTVDSTGRFSFSITKQKPGVTITVIASDKYGNSESKSTTVSKKTPPTLIVHPFSELQTELTGMTEPGSKVEVYIGGKLLQSVNADTAGKYSFNIGKQKAGVTITVTASDKAGNKDSKTITVLDKTPPKLTVQSISTKDTKVAGITEAGVKLDLYIGGILVQTKTANTSGEYSFSIEKQKAGVTITVVATDQADNKESKHVSVHKHETDESNQTTLFLTPFAISDQTTLVRGRTTVGATVRLYTFGVLRQTTTADRNGNYSFAISKPKSGVAFTITATNQVGKEVAKIVTVNGKIIDAKPEIETSKPVSSLMLYQVSSKSTTVRGKTNAYATVQLYTFGKLRQTVKADGKGNYSFKISKPKVGVNITVKAFTTTSKVLSKSVKVN